MSEQWAQELSTLQAEWRDVVSESPSDTVAWQQQLNSMQVTVRRLRQQGEWARGPADLMTIGGFHRKELAHSSVLRWLSDPFGSHGLGSALLTGLLAATGSIPPSLADTEATTEVPQDQSRADLVVRGKSWILVAELKIDASESPRQCQRLFEDWRAEPDLRLLFITPSGRAPVTTTSDAAARAWSCMSWAKVLSALDMAVHDRSTTGETAPAVEEYRRTLRHLVGRRQR